ncbi:hypothetical protein V7149_26395, partial [Bacillus sp. JJ1503]|uniref:hypothetical protein n=1 Tax=Bacillus sp. JJ1503 TaxID=3122956 RepID=UPI00302107F7
MMISGKDVVSLHKQNGEVVKEIKSTVQPDMIFIDDPNVPIEEGDHFIRLLPNGLTEKYLVLDRGFYDSGYGFNAHYQCEVKKVTTRELEQQNQIVYNVQGNNAKININSNDNSHNIVNIAPENLFNELRKVLVEGIQDRQHRRDIIDAVDDMEESQGQSSFIQNYQKFIALAANHMVLLTPFI